MFSSYYGLCQQPGSLASFLLDFGLFCMQTSQMHFNYNWRGRCLATLQALQIHLREGDCYISSHSLELDCLNNQCYDPDHLSTFVYWFRHLSNSFIFADILSVKLQLLVD